MPAIKIGLDIDTRKLINSFTGAALVTFSAKSGNIIDFELAITHNDVPFNIPADAMVEFAVKKPSASPGTYLAHSVASRTGWGTGSRWFFRVDLNPDPPYPATELGKNQEAEILITMPGDGQRISSLTFNFVILKNVIP